MPTHSETPLFLFILLSLGHIFAESPNTMQQRGNFSINDVGHLLHVQHGLKLNKRYTLGKKGRGTNII